MQRVSLNILPLLIGKAPGEACSSIQLERQNGIETLGDPAYQVRRVSGSDYSGIQKSLRIELVSRTALGAYRGQSFRILNTSAMREPKRFGEMTKNDPNHGERSTSRYVRELST